MQVARLLLHSYACLTSQVPQQLLDALRDKVVDSFTADTGIHYSVSPAEDLGVFAWHVSTTLEHLAFPTAAAVHPTEGDYRHLPGGHLFMAISKRVRWQFYPC